MVREEHLKRVEELVRDLALSDKSTDDFFRHILFVSVSIFGIIISLHSKLPESLYIRLVFALSMGILLLGILLVGLAVYDHAMIHKKRLEVHLDEYKNALLDERVPSFRTLLKRERTSLCEKWGLISLVSSLVLLLVYLLLLLFF
ncbi:MULTISPECIES: hypothetical protein [Butyricimonas]|uniref:hypothetical protein n=1 Tax=Butyricimonas TaxID=574697 RepID=UPI001D0978C9|nr:MULTISPECIES: hypothetical protein [Butyricimonas]MCB6971851.1 hypothetical protein [Butyricimonas synergistica]MCG4518859.1 hypothetical protein [Butyricimonas sp. DFI.6.44]